MNIRDIGNDAYKFMLEAVAIPSYTNTGDESLVTDYILDSLSRFTYLNANPDYFGKYDLVNDKYKRCIPWALFKGTSNKTIVLINHHDVVDTNEYGLLKKHAHSPDELKNALKDFPLTDDVERHLNGDDWTFGRGTADMKAGLAIQLSLFKHLSEHGCDNSILFLSLCDEETLSTGMRRAVSLLQELQERYNLDYKITIDSEPHCREEEDRFTIYDGSVGKTMAFAYIRGKKTHIGDIYNGLNPSLVLSNLILKTEVNPSFSDTAGSEFSSPPSWSLARDFKSNYDASIPNCAGGYISFLTYYTEPSTILNSLTKLTYESMQESIDLIEKGRALHFDNPSSNLKPRVILFSTLYEEVLNGVGIEKIRAIYEDVEEKINNKEISIPESNFLITAGLLECLDDNNPISIIGLSPPYYPHIINKDCTMLDKVGEAISQTEEALGIRIKRESYFSGISDLSYSGFDEDMDEIDMIKKNMPLQLHGHYDIPLKAMKELNIPVVNIGPWGLDYHKFTERVYKPDVLSTTPQLILNLIKLI